jgi:hypothetical protein
MSTNRTAIQAADLVAEFTSTSTVQTKFLCSSGSIGVFVIRIPLVITTTLTLD